MERTEEQQHKIDNIVKTHVFYLQNEVVELILKADENHDYIYNVYYVPDVNPEFDDFSEGEVYNILYVQESEGRTEGTIQGIHQWWSISKWLAEQFEAISIPVIMSKTYGYWWGRTTHGQPISQDEEWDLLLKYRIIGKQ